MNFDLKQLALATLVVFGLASGYMVVEQAVAREVKSTWHKGLPKQPHNDYLVHDLDLPLPKKVTPGAESAAPPSDAIVLFDGKNLDAWTGRGGKKAAWTVRDGYAELNNTGNIQTKQQFGDCQLHIEWASPPKPQGESQQVGNSGVFFMGLYEVQILDSYADYSYADGMAAGVYGQHAPLANACRKSGEWQSYDIIFRAPRYKEGKDGAKDEVTEPGRFTILHNGVLTAHHAQIIGATAWRQVAKYRDQLHPKGPISIQDHGDGQKVRFRNIWIRPLNLK